jgi:hypothetical protein
MLSQFASYNRIVQPQTAGMTIYLASAASEPSACCRQGISNAKIHCSHYFRLVHIGYIFLFSFTRVTVDVRFRFRPRHTTSGGCCCPRKR